MSGLISLTRFVSMFMLFCGVISLHLAFRATWLDEIFCEVVLIFILNLISSLKMIKFIIFFLIYRFFYDIFLTLGLVICSNYCSLLKSMFIDFFHEFEIG